MHDIKKAAGKLIWRLKPDKEGNFKSFTPNQNDVDSLNCILNWINNQKKETLNNNKLFAKLYIEKLAFELRNSNSTIFNNYSQIKVSTILDMPLESFYEAFKRDLYLRQFKKLLEDDSIVDEKGLVVSQNQFQESFNDDYIRSQLNHMMTEALNRFN